MFIYLLNVHTPALIKDYTGKNIQDIMSMRYSDQNQTMIGFVCISLCNVAENSPDVIPQTSTSLTSVPTLTSHASMPCLFTAIESLEGCAECRKWERDYENLCNQLDDKVCVVV